MVTEILNEIYELVKKDPAFRKQILSVTSGKQPVTSFCALVQERGFALYPMELIDAGEYFHAEMKRSTNGGGENSPMLCGQDDFFGMWLEEIKRLG